MPRSMPTSGSTFRLAVRQGRLMAEPRGTQAIDGAVFDLVVSRDAATRSTMGHPHAGTIIEANLLGRLVTSRIRSHLTSQTRA